MTWQLQGNIKGPEGSLTTRLRGDWAATAYVEGDVVTHNGSLWLCVADNTGLEPGAAPVTVAVGSVVPDGGASGGSSGAIYQAFVAASDRWVTHMSVPSGTSTARAMDIRDSTGAVLATYTTAGDGVMVPLSAPVQLVAGQTYHVGVSVALTFSTMALSGVVGSLPQSARRTTWDGTPATFGFYTRFTLHGDSVESWEVLAEKGDQGIQGVPGPAAGLTVDPPFATGAPGTNVEVIISGEAPNQTITGTIPRGDTGASSLGDILTAKGDIVVRDSVGAVRLPVGVNEETLIANSAAATGVKWGNLPIGNLLTANQAKPTTTGAYTNTSSTETAAGVYAATVTGGFNVYASLSLAGFTAGETVTLHSKVLCPGRTNRVRLQWRDLTNTSDVRNDYSAYVSSGSVAAATVTVPEGAGSVNVYVGSLSAGLVGDVVTIQEVGVWRGARGIWQPPGRPIPGQSTLRLNGSYDLSGTGSPEGVVAAPVGCTFTQTDALIVAGGILVWRKVTGTGSTGWQPETKRIDDALRDGASLIRTKPIAGRWVTVQGGRGTAVPVQDQLRGHPIWLDAGVLDRLGCEITVAAAGSTVRLGIYRDGGGFPATLVVDGGTVSGASTGTPEATINTTITESGVYWLVAVSQGGAPTLRTLAASPLPQVEMSSLAAAMAGTGASAGRRSSISGALPATNTWITNWTNQAGYAAIPVIAARYLSVV